MNFVKYLMPFLMAAGFMTASAYAQIAGQETRFDRELRQRDDQPVREFIESKENIDVNKKAQNLDISGDVRFEWRTIQEKGIALYTNDSSGYGSDSSNSFHERYRAFRGGDYVDLRGVPLSRNDFDIEFNLKIKYSFERAFAMAHLQFDNPAGIRGRNDCFGDFGVFNYSGSEVKNRITRDSRRSVKGSGDGFFINLKRAYIGYNIWADDKHRLDIEVGRRKLDDIFDSEVEFTSRFDGVLLKYSSVIEDLMDWYWNTGVFVIDERVNHFGFVTEMGLLNIFDTGLDLRYSFIDWTKHGRNRCFIRNPLGTEFQNSQVSFSYTIHPTFGCLCDKEIPVEFYGGLLCNHAARKNQFTRWKKKNLAWYAGVYIGEVDKKGDWSLDIEYIGVQAQAVSEFDVGSIGRGNIFDENLTDILDGHYYSEDPYSYSFPSSSGKLVGYFPRRGNTNFVGWRCEFLYAITDNLSLDFIYEISRAEDRRIGGPHRYSDFEIEAIYAF